MAVILPAAMLLLPLAILYFIDPGVASYFLEFSVPYMVIPIAFVIVLVIVITIIGEVIRSRKQTPVPVVQYSEYAPSQNSQTQNISNPPVQILEREIVREIVKVRCDYCGTLNFETATKCESCGANL